MDKLKYIKLENEDGSYSNSIPLSVDADHVDVESREENISLSDYIESNDTDIDSIHNTNTNLQTQINNHTTSINANASAINTQKTRIDNLATLTEGSTTGDAELTDIRIAYNGIPYNNAGNAVRGQIEDMILMNKEKQNGIFIKDIDINNSIILYNSGLRFLSHGTTEPADENWAISDYIDISNGVVVSGYTMQGRPAIVEYDENKNIVNVYINESPYRLEKITKTYYGSTPSLKYVRLQSIIGLQAVSSAFSIKQYDLNDFIQETTKNKYQSGEIHFTVDVNVNFPNDSTSDSVQDAEDIETMQCVLILPSNYNNNIKTPTKLCVYCHGAGGIVNSSTGGEISGASYLVNAGYAVLDCAGVVGNQTSAGSCQNMGGPIAIQGYRKAIEYVMNNYNVEDKIYLHGGSMGGLMALNLVNSYPEIVKVLSLFFPVTDMYNQAWLHPWWAGDYGTKKMIATLYNFDDNTGLTYEANKVIGFNPINNKSIEVNNDKYTSLPVPIKIWHGTADTTVDISYSRLFVEHLKNYGCVAELREVNGMGHSANNTIKTEELYWLNRF